MDRMSFTAEDRRPAAAQADGDRLAAPAGFREDAAGVAGAEVRGMTPILARIFLYALAACGAVVALAGLVLSLAVTYGFVVLGLAGAFVCAMSLAIANGKLMSSQPFDPVIDYVNDPLFRGQPGNTNLVSCPKLHD